MLENIKRQKSGCYAQSNKLQKCSKYFARIKHFQEHKQNTSKDAKFIALHDEAILTTRLKC